MRMCFICPKILNAQAILAIWNLYERAILRAILITLKMRDNLKWRMVLINILTLKRLWEEAEGMNFIKREWNPVFLWLLILFKSHLSWKFHKEDMKNFSANVSYFHLLSSISLDLWLFLATKKLTTSSYNRWCHYFFIFNHFFLNFWPPQKKN